MLYSKILSLLFALTLGLFVQNAFAQQTDEGLDNVCDLSGGSWHTSTSGWACCWNNWGCYGCTSGNCVMNCKTPRCKKANDMSMATSGHKEITGLAPKGMKAPIISIPKANQAVIFKGTLIDEPRN